MGWQGAPDFTDIAEHMLAIIDVWNRPEMSGSPFGRLDAVTSMSRICFGEYQARTVANRVLSNFDEFDERLSQDRCEPDHDERKKYLTKLLLAEFAKRGGRYMAAG